MAIAIWKKPYTLRSYGAVTNVNGYPSESYTDRTVMLDIQTTSKTQTTAEDGKAELQRIKAFGGEEIKVTDGTSGDRVYFQSKWFECVSSRLSENTCIAHWTSEFVECANQDAPPGVTA